MPAQLKLSRHGFSAYDVSPMIDAGWRVYLGQVPGRDFVVTFPASLYLGVALAYRVIGVTWPAIALADCALYLGLLLLGLSVVPFITRAFGPVYRNRFALSVLTAYVAGQTILLISVNYLWHASMAEGFGIYAVLSAVPLLGEHRLGGWRRLAVLAHLTLACSCLALSKPNTGFPVIALCLVAPALAGTRRLPLLAVGAIALAVDAVVLHAVHVSLPAMLSAYLGLTGRLVPKAFFNGILYAPYARYGLANLLVYAIAAPAVTAASLLFWKQRHSLPRRPLPLLAGCAIVTSILGMGTNFDYKLTDTPLALLGLCLLGYCGADERWANLRFRTGCAGMALLLLAFYFGRTRLRMQTIGLWADDKCPAQTVFTDPFLGRMTACPVVPETLAAVDTALARYPHRSVFFGPAMEFLYAARRIPSPLHLPDWWDPGTSFPLSHMGQVSEAWKNDHFDLLLLNEDEDLGQLPPAVVERIQTHYVRVPGFAAIHVYVPRA